MAFKFSTGLRNGMLNNQGFKEAMDGGFLDIFAGTVPSSADDALGSATLLCTISNASGVTGITWAVPAGGMISKATAEVWSGNNVADGTATFCRLRKAGDTGTASTSALRVQGTVGIAGADLNLSSVSLVATAPQAINFATIIFPTN